MSPKRSSYLALPAAGLLLGGLFLVHRSYPSPQRPVTGISIDQKVVIHTADITITGYELEKNLHLFRSEFAHRNGHPPDTAAIDQWIGGFIDRTYFLADAYKKGYDTSREVTGSVNAMANMVIAQQGGLLDEKITETASTLDPTEIRTALERNARHYRVKYLKFRDYNAAMDFLGAALVKDKNEFENDLEKSSKTDPSLVSSGEDTVAWPFLPRGDREEVIFSLKKDEVSPILPLHDGSYVFELEDVQQAAPPPDSLRSRMEVYLKLQKKDNLRQRFKKEVNDRSETRIDQDLVTRLKDGFQREGEINTFDKSRFSGIRDRTILTYKMNGRTDSVSVDAFMDYYNFLPMRRQIETENDIMSFLQSLVYSAYAHKEAEETGITKDPKFLLDKENYKKEIVYNSYERKEWKTRIAITEDEIRSRYDLEKTKFIQATDLVISAYTQTDRKEAVSRMFALRTKGFPSMHAPAALDSSMHQIVHFKDSSLSDTVRTILFAMKVGSVSRPVPVNGKYRIFIKESESGSRIQDLTEVRALIIKELEEEKLERIKQQCLPALKALYPSDNEIDYQKYYHMDDNRPSQDQPLPGKIGDSTGKGLKDYYAAYFPIGVAVTPWSLKGPDTTLILQQFNSLTPENAMKWGPIHPQENSYYWKDADAIVDFAVAHGLKVRGHNLCWHEHNPAWLFKDSSGNQVTKEVLLQRLKDHILTVVGRYKGRVYAWDVVNEAVDNDSSRILRNSLWYQICGEDFIVKAFEWAHQADPAAQLFYNDYNTERPEKRARVYKFLKQLKEAGVPVTGVGLQAHWSIFEPAEKDLKESIRLFSSLGLKVQITELDMSIYPWEKNRREKRTGESDSLTSALEQAQAEQYRKVFAVFRGFKGVLNGVTFWNISDRYTWLDAYPVRGRKNYPLLFDRNLQPKKAYWEVVHF